MCACVLAQSASEGLDDQVADYEKLKSERRQALVSGPHKMLCPLSLSFCAVMHNVRSYCISNFGAHKLRAQKALPALLHQ